MSLYYITLSDYCHPVSLMPLHCRRSLSSLYWEAGVINVRLPLLAVLIMVFNTIIILICFFSPQIVQLSVHTFGLHQEGGCQCKYCVAERSGQDLDRPSLTSEVTKCQTNSSTVQVCSAAKYLWNRCKTTTRSLRSLLLLNNWNWSQPLLLQILWLSEALALETIPSVF